MLLSYVSLPLRALRKTRGHTNPEAHVRIARVRYSENVLACRSRRHHDIETALLHFQNRQPDDFDLNRFCGPDAILVHSME